VEDLVAKLIIRTGEVLDTGGEMNFEALNLEHQGCGDLIARRDVGNSDYYKITCEGCDMKLILDAQGVTKVMRVAINGQEQNITEHLLNNSDECFVIRKK
jgi:hypothetical protein